jgi:5-formyltetrahydrofolate cyclo-ligase
MTKAEIRKTYLQKRQALSETEFTKLNQLICDRFFAGIDVSSVQVLHTFLPIEKQREVNTWLIIDRIKKEFPNVKISVPRINNQTATIESFFFEGKEQLEKNTWDIMEPKQGIPTPIDKIDMVLVPLLAFDKKGNRVGYGRGFYDKFLATLPPTTKKVGLSIFPAVDNVNDPSSYDIPVDVAVTPEAIVTVK